MFRYNCISIFLSKLEFIKLFGCDKYKSIFSYKLSLRIWRENDKKVVFSKNFKNKIVIK